MVDSDGYHPYWIRNTADNLCIEVPGVEAVAANHRPAGTSSRMDNGTIGSFCSSRSARSGRRHYLVREVVSKLCVELPDSGTRLVLTDCETDGNYLWALVAEARRGAIAAGGAGLDEPTLSRPCAAVGGGAERHGSRTGRMVEARNWSRTERAHADRTAASRDLRLSRPDGVGDFWSRLLGDPITYQDDDFVVVSTSNQASGLAFQRSPDQRPATWPDPAVPQQIHLDVMVEDVPGSYAAVLGLGATKLDGDDVFADPAGHPFCLIKRPAWAPAVPEGDSCV